MDPKIPCEAREMSQCRLVDFAGFMTRVEDEHRQILEAVGRSRQVAAYYQEDAAKKTEALRLLKGELIRQHQAELYRSNELRFSSLRKKVYEFFRDVTFRSWNPEDAPHGVYWKNAFLDAKGEAWLTDVDGATYRRRLNELADKRITNPPLLEWKIPGRYVLAKILEVRR
jgi:hypothetical protein